MQKEPKLIAIIGGSGAGKTWLSRRLEYGLSPSASSLSLDDFYLDRSTLQPALRNRINYDHPRAIDWPRFEAVLDDCRAGKPTLVPRYQFASHTRLPEDRTFSPRPAVLVDGLWLLSRPRVRAMFDFVVYLECPVHLRLKRRLTRDLAERARDPGSVREQFWKTVAPMHDRFVAPQVFDADIILKQPSEAAEIENLAETIRALVSEDDLTMPNDSSADWPWPARSKTVRHQRFPRGRRHGLEAVAVNHVN